MQRVVSFSLNLSTYVFACNMNYCDAVEISDKCELNKHDVKWHTADRVCITFGAAHTRYNGRIGNVNNVAITCNIQPVDVELCRKICDAANNCSDYAVSLVYTCGKTFSYLDINVTNATPHVVKDVDELISKDIMLHALLFFARSVTGVSVCMSHMCKKTDVLRLNLCGHYCVHAMNIECMTSCINTTECRVITVSRDHSYISRKCLCVDHDKVLEQMSNPYVLEIRINDKKTLYAKTRISINKFNYYNSLAKLCFLAMRKNKIVLPSFAHLEDMQKELYLL